MRMIVPLAAALVLLAPVLTLAQEQELAQEPVVGLYEYPTPEPARAVSEGSPDDAEPADEGYEMFENEGQWEYSDEGEYPDDMQIDDTPQEGIIVETPSYMVSFHSREMANGLYAWTLIEQHKLSDGNVEVCRIWYDENDLHDRTCTIKSAEEAAAEMPFSNEARTLE